MSGGSFNYVSVWCGDTERLYEKFWDLKRLNESLSQDFPGTIAARHTDEVVRLMTHLMTEIDRRSLLLSDVWHAEEWYDSGDWGRERTQQVIDKYEEKFNAPS
jgi:hypothetical protein